MIGFKRGPYISRLSRANQNALRVHVVPDGDARRQKAGVIPSVAQGLHSGLVILVVTITEKWDETANGPD